MRVFGAARVILWCCFLDRRCRHFDKLAAIGTTCKTAGQKFGRDKLIDRFGIATLCTRGKLRKSERPHLTNGAKSTIQLDPVMWAGKILEECGRGEQKKCIVARQRHGGPAIREFCGCGE